MPSSKDELRDKILTDGEVSKTENHTFVYIDIADLMQLIDSYATNEVKLALYIYRGDILAENYCTELGTYDFDGIAAMVIGEEDDETTLQSSLGEE